MWSLLAVAALTPFVACFHPGSLPRSRSALSAARRTAPITSCADRGPASRGGLRILEWIPSQQLLVKTARFVWTTLWRIMLSELAPQSPEGAYVRPAPQTGSGAQWPSDLPMVKGRYHVYVGNACPWCHRVTIALALRGQLGEAITYTVLSDDPGRASRGGWCFEASDPDPLCDANDLKAVYDRLSPDGTYSGRCTAPLLVDLATAQIISNESADIVRMLNSFALRSAAAEGSGAKSDSAEGGVVGDGMDKAVDLYPAHLAAEIDEANRWVYEQVRHAHGPRAASRMPPHLCDTARRRAIVDWTLG
jgi:putative glutathione S-transferase